jgi:hypothetical protein
MAYAPWQCTFHTFGISCQMCKFKKCRLRRLWCGSELRIGARDCVGLSARSWWNSQETSLLISGAHSRVAQSHLIAADDVANRQNMRLLAALRDSASLMQTTA